MATTTKKKNKKKMMMIIYLLNIHTKTRTKTTNYELLTRKRNNHFHHLKSLPVPKLIYLRFKKIHTNLKH